MSDTAQQTEAPAGGVVYDLLELAPVDRWVWVATLDEGQRAQLFRAVNQALGTPFGLWADDPVGFIEGPLGEKVWSKQRKVAESVRDHERTCVPACHAPGKTWLAARLVAHHVACHRPGSAQAVTLAPRFRQVKFQLWPHIRRLHKRSGILPGVVDMVQWKIDGEVVAYGFAAAEYDEDAVQGIHAEHLLIVVDEAGGIGHTIGNALESLTTGFHTRLFAPGNPPTDEEGSWFEERSLSPLWNHVRIAAEDTPNFTGEACPEEIRRNLVDQGWVDAVTAEFGADSPYVIARVHARFPRGAANKAIPFAWVEEALENTEPDPSSWVRLGVDVAADGGDELVIARAEGFTCRVVHTSSGEANANPTDVAGRVLEEIRAAESLARELSSLRPVRVKVDAIGVGWGVAGILEAWGKEGLHGAEVIRMVASERAKEADRYVNQRAEMWWEGRGLMQPRAKGDGTYGPGVVRLEVDRRTAAQLAGPKYGHGAGGRLQIESKKAMKERGLASPDRADAVLLAFYEPGGGPVVITSPVGQRIPTRPSRTGPTIPHRRR